MTTNLETMAVHAGTEPDPTTNARITPIYQTASMFSMMSIMPPICSISMRLGISIAAS